MNATKKQKLEAIARAREHIWWRSARGLRFASDAGSSGQ